MMPYNRDATISDEKKRDLSGRRVLVTGASGVIGRSLVPALLELGAHVVAVSRDPIPDLYDRWSATGRFEAHDRDLRHEPLPGHRLVDVTDCIHLAAILFPVSEVTYYRDNLAIMRNVAHGIAKHARKLGRFVLFSSLAARGQVPDTPDDGRVALRTVSDYGHSKLACEQLAMGLLPSSLPLIILRPGIVLSRDDARLMQTIRSIPHTPGFIAARLPRFVSAIEISDLAQATVEALRGDLKFAQAGREPFDICHPEPIEPQSLVGNVSRRQSNAADGRVSSGVLLQTLAALSTMASKVTGSEPLLTFDKLREMQEEEWQGDSSAFMSASDWTPKVSPSAFIAAARS